MAVGLGPLSQGLLSRKCVRAEARVAVLLDLLPLPTEPTRLLTAAADARAPRAGESPVLAEACVAVLLELLTRLAEATLLLTLPRARAARAGEAYVCCHGASYVIVYTVDFIIVHTLDCINSVLCNYAVCHAMKCSIALYAMP